MTPEERSLLERTHKLAEENNALLISMRRRARYGTAFRVSYWILIIALSFGAFYFIQPYLENISGLYGNAESSVNSVKDLFK